MITRSFLVISLLFAGALTPSLALAQTSDADKATARDLTIEGYRALESRDYTAALDRFTRADALYHAPSVILGLARAQVGLGKLVSAQELYSRAAHETLPPSASTASKKAVRDAQRELEALSLRVPSVIIRVKGSDAARVTLDGVEVRSAALGVKRPVDPGKHLITASAAGLATREITVTLAEGKSESVTLELKPRPTEAPPAVVVALTAPAMTPPDPIPPETGPIPAPGSTRRALSFVALGLGGAGLLVGGITGGIALSEHGEIADSCAEGHCSLPQQSTLQPKIDAYETMGAASTIGFIAGGALAATGVILILTTPGAKTPRATVAPIFGPGFFGAKGSF